MITVALGVFMFTTVIVTLGDPGPELRALCERCGLPYDRNMLDHQYPRTSFGGLGDPAVMTRRRVRVNTRSVGRKKQLAPEFREVIVARCSQAAAEWGYTL